MDLKQLRAKGAFVKAPPVPVEVTWVHEDEETKETMTDTFTVHVRRMSVGWLDRVLVPGPDPMRSRTATLITEGILFGEGGNERMSYEEAYQLNFGLATALLEAFQKVNRKEESTTPKT
jgi:hypothetical protein